MKNGDDPEDPDKELEKALKQEEELRKRIRFLKQAKNRKEILEVYGPRKSRNLEIPDAEFEWLRAEKQRTNRYMYEIIADAIRLLRKSSE